MLNQGINNCNEEDYYNFVAPIRPKREISATETKNS